MANQNQIAKDAEKLSPEIIRLILADCDAGILPLYDMAVKYGVSRDTISELISMRDERSKGINSPLYDKYRTKDKFGNNIDFPDSVVGSMTVKGLIGKWCDVIVSDVQYCLTKHFFAAPHNVDAGDVRFVQATFREANAKIQSLRPVLEDMVAENIYGIEDILIAVYGVQSDEVYMYRTFNSLLSKMPTWDRDYMWNDASGNPRLARILGIAK